MCKENSSFWIYIYRTGMHDYYTINIMRIFLLEIKCKCKTTFQSPVVTQKLFEMYFYAVWV